MTHEKETKVLSLSLPIATTVAIVIAAIGWASSYWGNQYAQAKATDQVGGRVNLLELRVSNTEAATANLANTVGKINDNVVRLLIKNNIEPVR